MPLRATISASPETLTDILLAADDRYQEAEELLLSQRYDGCVYLLGYAAEMWLKAACLRLRGHGPLVQVMSALPTLKKWMKTISPTVPFADYHDLSFFSECLARLRAQQGRPLPVALETELRGRIATGLYDEWMVDMRYRRSALTAADAWSALLNAWWMKTNLVQLI